MTAAAVRLPVFRNEHLSVSRIKRFEQCPHAFELGYVNKLNAQRGRLLAREIEATAFGSFVHLVLERIFARVIDEEFEGKVPDEWVSETYRSAFQEAIELSGTDVFNEGLSLVRSYFRHHPTVDHASVLAVEREFRIEVDRFTLLGYIDRVDKIDDHTIRIVDYKTNRVLFDRDEIDDDLQMSAYGLAARSLYPWATNVEYAYEMLRFGSTLTTTRTSDQLDDAHAYIAAMGERIEAQTEWPAHLNLFCGWCDFRDHCNAYNHAVETNPEFRKLTKEDGIEIIAAERERAAALEKIAKKRKDDLGKLIAERLKTSNEESLRAAGFRYKIMTRTSTSFDTVKLCNLIFAETNVDSAKLCEEVLVVDAKRLDAFVRSLDLPTTKRTMLKAKIDAIAEHSTSRGWLDARKEKGS